SFALQVARYGTDAPLNAQPSALRFGIGTAGVTPSSECEWVSISRFGDGTNWLVVSNPTSTDATYMLRFTADSGTPATDMSLLVPARSQRHLFTETMLAAGESGAVKVCSPGGTAFLAESMHYYIDSGSGEVCSAYGTLSRRATCGYPVGSYNTFLGQSSLLRVESICPDMVDVYVRPYTSDGTQLADHPLWVMGDQGATYDLFWSAFGVGQDRFGKVEVAIHPQTPGGFLAEVVKLRPSSTCSPFDMADAVPVR
ncbi:MAG: hypothetical protein KDD44_02585, partial [Bdellovibrionales bacterium]|nr:hypothetical protein [Bdellovibrionales bacterium]